MKLFKLLGASFLALTVVSCIGNLGKDTSSTPPTKAKTPASVKTPAPQPAPAPAPKAWKNINLVNEWGEVESKGAVSEFTSPSQGRSYLGTRARLMVDGCNSAWIRFTNDPNITGGDIGDGYHTYSLRARTNGKDVTEPMIQAWGSEDLNWRSGEAAVIRGFASEDSYQILVPHYGGGAVYKFDMSGAKDAIAKTCPSAVN